MFVIPPLSRRRYNKTEAERMKWQVANGCHPNIATGQLHVFTVKDRLADYLGIPKPDDRYDDEPDELVEDINDPYILPPDLMLQLRRQLKRQHSEAEANVDNDASFASA